MSKYQLFNSLSEEDYGFLRDKMKREGFSEVHPVIQDEDGNVIDGHQRLKIAEELGITPHVSVMIDVSENDKLMMAISENLAGRTITPLEWGFAILNLLDKLGKSLPPTLMRGRYVKLSYAPPEGSVYVVLSDLARRLSVSEKVLVYRLNLALDFKVKASGALQGQLAEGKIEIDAAAKASKLTEEEQEVVVASEDPVEAVRGISRKKREVKKKSTEASSSTEEGSEDTEEPDVPVEAVEAPEDDLTFRGLLNPNTIIDTSLADITEYDTAPLHTLEAIEGYTLMLLPDDTIETLKKVVLKD